jgi:diacylglycerol kinase (ATP)
LALTETEARMLVVMNEAAGRIGSGEVAEVVAELETTGTVHVAACADEAGLNEILDRRGDRTLVVVGGDGSLHTTMKHLWWRGEADVCPVGLIPLGTGNDFARGVGIPLDPAEAARLIASGAAARPVDLITDDAGGVVVNAVHVGVGADAAALARPLKRFLRSVAFPVGSAAAGIRARGWHLRIELDAVAVASGRRRVLMAGLSNAPTIAGGTAVLGPTASPTDGVFDLTVSLATGPLARIGYAARLVAGTHPQRADVVTATGRTLTIAGEPFHINADGELVGPVTRRTWTIRPGAWRCILPPIGG